MWSAYTHLHVFGACTCALLRAFDCPTRCVCVCRARAFSRFACSRAHFLQTCKHTHHNIHQSLSMHAEAQAHLGGNPRLGSRHNVTICQLALSRSICDTRLQEESERSHKPSRARSAADMSHRFYQAAADSPMQHQRSCARGWTYGSRSTEVMSSLMHSFHAAGLTGRGADSPAESSTGSCT